MGRVKVLLFIVFIVEEKPYNTLPVTLRRHFHGNGKLQT